MTEEDLKKSDEYARLNKDNKALLYAILMELKQLNSLVLQHPKIRESVNHAIKMAEKKKKRNIQIIT